MTLSQKSVLDIFKNRKYFTINDLYFILTVIRDNCTDDDLYDFLNLCINYLIINIKKDNFNNG